MDQLSLQGSPPIFRNLLIIFFMSLIIWHIYLSFKEKFKRTKEKAVKADSRRDIINALKLQFARPPKSKENPDPFWEGLKHVIVNLGGSFSLIILLIGIIWTSVKLYEEGTLQIQPIYVALLISLGVAMSCAGLYIYYYNKYKDFPALLEGIFSKSLKERSSAFKRAASIHPSEFAYTSLGNIQRDIIELDTQRINKQWFENDYTLSINYYAKGSALAPNETRPLRESFQLKTKMKDFEGALSDWEKINEIENQTTPNSPFATKINLAKLYDDWGEGLMIIGNFEGAIEKFNAGIEEAEKSSQTHSWVQSSLLINRSRSLFYIGDYETCIKDLYNGFELLINYHYKRLDEAKKDSVFPYNFRLDNAKYWIDHVVEFMIKVYQVLENQDAAFKYLEHFRHNEKAFEFPILTKQLIKLLSKAGKAEEANLLYKDYLNKGFDKFDFAESAFHPSSFFSKSQLIEQSKAIDTIEDEFDFISKAYKIGHFEIAYYYLLPLLEEIDTLAPLDQYKLLTLYAQMKEAEWKYKEALKYYSKRRSIKEAIYDEGIIARIKKSQRVFPEVLDAYEGYFYELKQANAIPPNNEIMEFATLKEELGEYEEAISILSEFGHIENQKYILTLQEKKVTKTRMAN